MASSTRLLPNNTTAKYLRPLLKKAGVEDFVESITTGRYKTRIRLTHASHDGYHDEVSANKIAEAIRPLWHDGATRVQVLYGGLVTIERKGWYRTVANTAEGLAQLEAEEKERNEGLLAGQANDGAVRACDCFFKVTYEPSDEHPRQPWVRHDGQRFTPWEVYLDRHANPDRS